MANDRRTHLVRSREEIRGYDGRTHFIAASVKIRADIWRTHFVSSSVKTLLHILYAILVDNELLLVSRSGLHFNSIYNPNTALIFFGTLVALGLILAMSPICNRIKRRRDSLARVMA